MVLSATKAYLDDSGTHDTSPVIVMGGLIATERAWGILEPQWKALLTKYGIEYSHAHMNRCKRRSVSSFEGWSDFKRHRALTEFRRLIEQTGGRLLASGMSRHAWNAVCNKTRMRELFADPIDFLQAMCLRKALEARRKNLLMGTERVSITFDKRLQSYVTWSWQALGYQRRYPHRFAGYNFGESSEVVALHVADMIAYEAFVYLCDREKLGRDPESRPNFQRMRTALSEDVAYFTEANLLDFMRKFEQLRGA